YCSSLTKAILRRVIADSIYSVASRQS
ncbi:hypothetical protein A5830_002189, partial [Enterococcus faecalis]